MLTRALPLAACLLLFAGVVPGPRDVRAGPEVVTGSLRVSVRNPLRQLDPALAQNDAERLCVLNIFDQLYEYEHKTRPFKLRPLMAAGLPVVSKDRKTYTIKLRAGLRFQDDPCFAGGKGRAVTAADVVFCFKRLMDAHVHGNGQWLFERRLAGLDAFRTASGLVPAKSNRSTYTKAQGYPQVEGLQALDDRTVRLHLVEPYPALTWVLAHSYASIYPPEAVAKYGAAFGQHPVGCGPYELKSFRGSEYLMLMRRRNYRAGVGDGDEVVAPRNNSVTVTVVQDARAEWQRFLDGEFDLAPVPTGWVHEIFDAIMQPLPRIAPYHLSLHAVPEMNVNYVAFNMKDKVLGAPAGERGRALRRAISLVWDDAWTHHPHWSQLVEPLAGPLLPEAPEYTAYFTNDYERYTAAGTEELELAKELLAEAGWPGEAGFPVIQVDVVGDGKGGSLRTFTRIRDRLALLGIKTEAVYLPYPEVRDRVLKRAAMMWTISWRLDYPDPENLLQLFYGPAQPTPNDSGYENPEYDALYEEARALPAGEERATIYQEMQDLLAEDCVYIWTYRQRRLTFMHQWLSNWSDNDICSKWFKHCVVDTSGRNDYHSEAVKRKRLDAVAKALKRTKAGAQK